MLNSTFLKYIDRHLKLENNFSTLSLLQTLMLEKIPFENIDCLEKGLINIDLDYLEDKLLHKHRGGYCFELNILFNEVLNQLGFNSRPVLCRSMWRGNTINSKTHIALIVTIENKLYLSDAGFGGPGFYRPIPLEINHDFADTIGTFKLIPDEVHGYILQKKIQENWINVYAFNLDQVFFNDLFMSNYFTSTYSESFFLNNLVASRFLQDGRLTLMNNVFTKYIDNKSTERIIQSKDELIEILNKDFLISISHLSKKTLQIAKVI